MHKRGQIKKFSILALLLILLLALAYGAHNFFTNNFHAVIPGKVYRSALLDREDLSAVIDKYHIKTIFNLTGSLSAVASRDEVVVARKLHVKLINTHYPSHGTITKERLRQMISVLQDAQRPLLIHCREGVDRTGLAAAITIILTGNYTSDAWRDQVSWRYNLLSPTSIGYEVMHAYVLWLKQSNLADTKANFLQWANSKSPIIPTRGWFFT